MILTIAVYRSTIAIRCVLPSVSIDSEFRQCSTVLSRSKEPAPPANIPLSSVLLAPESQMYSLLMECLPILSFGEYFVYGVFQLVGNVSFTRYDTSNHPTVSSLMCATQRYPLVNFMWRNMMIEMSWECYHRFKMPKRGMMLHLRFPEADQVLVVQLRISLCIETQQPRRPPCYH